MNSHFMENNYFTKQKQILKSGILKIFIYFIYLLLAVTGLSCGMWTS